MVPGLQSTDWLPHEITRRAEQHDECCNCDEVFHVHDFHPFQVNSVLPHELPGGVQRHWTRLRCGLAHHRAWGKREGMKSSANATTPAELDLETLVWTRGPSFALSSLDGRLMCPRCGSRRSAAQGF